MDAYHVNCHPPPNPPGSVLTTFFHRLAGIIDFLFVLTPWSTCFSKLFAIAALSTLRSYSS